MKQILHTIVSEKKKEVSLKKQIFPSFTDDILFRKTKIQPMTMALKEKEIAIIAEFKRKSPSRASIQLYADPVETVTSYEKNGAAGISVLTDEKFFGAKINDLPLAVQSVSIPVLRKEFIVDEYQVFETRSLGADVILLIAGILTPHEVKMFSHRACQIGLEVLLEIKNEEELNRHFCEHINIVGVNNRNLDSLEISLETSFRLAEKIPGEAVKISESGIRDPENIIQLKNAGYDGFLIGEHLMKKSDPGAELKKLINNSKTKNYAR